MNDLDSKGYLCTVLAPIAHHHIDRIAQLCCHRTIATDGARPPIPSTPSTRRCRPLRRGLMPAEVSVGRYDRILCVAMAIGAYLARVGQYRIPWKLAGVGFPSICQC